ncbi:MAG: hypothetical protein M0Z80_01290 [Treponema sp.]|nr:hypothetical protein [Treponema sp.]
MDYSIIHLGGPEHTGPAEAAAVTTIIASHPGPLVLVISAFGGTAEALEAAAEYASPSAGSRFSESGKVAAEGNAARALRAERLASLLYEKHLAFLVSLAPEPGEMRRACDRLAEIRDDLVRLLGGPHSSAARRDRLRQTGELLFAVCVVAAFSRVGRTAVLVESEALGRALREAESGTGREATLPAIRAALRGHSTAVVPEYYMKLSGRQPVRVE